MTDSDLRKIAYEYGFAGAYFLPPPDFERHDDEPGLVWETSRYPWAKVSCLLVWSYSPYPRGCRIPAYYVNSNSSYHVLLTYRGYRYNRHEPLEVQEQLKRIFYKALCLIR